MAGYFELKSSKSGKFTFNLKAGNHEVILTSQAYENKESAKKGIASVQAHGKKENSFEIKKASDGSPYFVLKASNGQVIGKSEMYSSDSSATRGIASVMANCITKIVKEQA